ncbi:MAG: hypothetical protein AAF493_00665 [Pseudomonadota bacterium]
MDIDVDLSVARDHAHRVLTMLRTLRERQALARYEYCRVVRIRPTARPFSHPEITLSTFVRDDLSLLCMYLHEQMHWYVTWFSQRHPTQWRRLNEALRNRYPEASINDPDPASAYLHLVVNWLEYQCVSEFQSSDTVRDHLAKLPFYQWTYATVLRDVQPLDALFITHGLTPIHPATAMSARDLELAARGHEQSIRAEPRT